MFQYSEDKSTQGCLISRIFHDEASTLFRVVTKCPLEIHTREEMAVENNGEIHELFEDFIAASDCNRFSLTPPHSLPRTLAQQRQV
jgi:hypothetical protein